MTILHCTNTCHQANGNHIARGASHSQVRYHIIDSSTKQTECSVHMHTTNVRPSPNCVSPRSITIQKRYQWSMNRARQPMKARQLRQPIKTPMPFSDKTVEISVHIKMQKRANITQPPKENSKPRPVMSQVRWISSSIWRHQHVVSHVLKKNRAPESSTCRLPHPRARFPSRWAASA